jgi:apolipoprotein N-acyltransferase
MPSWPAGAPEAGPTAPEDPSLLARTRTHPERVAGFAPPGRYLVPPTLSALLLILALPPFHVLPLAFVALAPLAAGLALIPPGPGSGTRASLQGGVFGLVFWGFSLVWVPLELGRHFSWALPAYGLLLMLLGGLAALFAWWAHGLYHRAGIPLILAVPLAWVAVEWIKANFPMGLAFPWLGLGVALAPWPSLLALAEWTGERGVAFWLSMASGWVGAEVVRLGASPRGSEPRLHGRIQGPRILMPLALLLPVLLGWARARTLSLLPGPTVVVVGTDVPRELRDDPEAWAREALDQVRAALPHPSPHFRPDLILLPEATIPIPLEREEAGPFLDELLSMAGAFDTPFVVGATGGVPPGEGSPAVTNSAYLVLPDQGLHGRYDKGRLVPGMEAGRYLPGPGGGTLEGGGWVYGPLVCYESLFGGLGREGRRGGAQALLNLTSDVWFGEEGRGLGSLFLRQHPAHLVLRVAETRMPAARAANGGYSFILDPLGRRASPLVPPTGGVAAAELHTTQGMTVFARTGDLVGPLAALAGLLLLLLRGRGTDASGSRRTLPAPRVEG